MTSHFRGRRKAGAISEGVWDGGVFTACCAPVVIFGSQSRALRDNAPAGQTAYFRVRPHGSRGDIGALRKHSIHDWKHIADIRLISSYRDLSACGETANAWAGDAEGQEMWNLRGASAV